MTKWRQPVQKRKTEAVVAFDEFIRLGMAAAGYRARALRTQLHLPAPDVADLRQELLLDLIVRFRSFDPARGTCKTFIDVVIGHRARHVTHKVWRERALYGVSPISLDESLSGEHGTRGDLIAEAQGLAFLFGQPIDAFADVERRFDVERALGSLSSTDRTLCTALSHTTIDALASAGRGARSSLYRRLRQIRLALMAVGLRAE